MRFTDAIKAARQRAGLTVTELAQRAGTSRATLSAYEHGHKAPTAQTLERILDAAGFVLTIDEKITFREVPAYRGRTITVPNRLPRRVGPSIVRLPTTVFWSDKPRDYDLANLVDRKIVYRAVMSEGGPAEIIEFIDRDMLLEVFDDMGMPPATHEAWAPVVEAARRGK